MNTLKYKGYIGSVAYSEPERLKEIRMVMDRIADSKVIPDEFRQMYNTFTKTLKLK